MVPGDKSTRLEGSGTDISDTGGAWSTGPPSEPRTGTASVLPLALRLKMAELTGMPNPPEKVDADQNAN